MKKEANTITLFDENDKELDVELLFSIVHPDTGVRYIYVIDPEDSSSVVVLESDDKGNVSVIGDNVTPELEEFIQDTFQAYQNGDLVKVDDDGEMQEQSEHSCCCNHEHHDDDECCCGNHEHDDECCCGDHHKEGECCCGDDCDCKN